MDIIKVIEQEQINENVANFKVGDQVKVHVKIKEGNRERIQVFEGFVIKRQNAGSNETFTVRKISYGVGVERTFPVHSKNIDKIEVVRSSKVRRAKLYYLRERTGKAVKPAERV
ncbi:MAG: 50S ribosomal protein L19 [Clostridia bacterium]|nr:50S ribosomal protein L19 [Clostridia bacterium]